MRILRIISSVAHSIGSAITNDPEIKKIVAYNPKFFAFIKKRIAPDEMFGLHLTIGALITTFFVFFFFGIIRQFIGNESILESDISIVNFLQLLRHDGVDPLMVLFSTLGRWSIIFFGVCATALVCIRGRRWHYLIALISSVFIAIFFSGILRELIENVRPSFANTLVANSPPFFPSGYTFVAFTFYGIITYFLVRACEPWFGRFCIAFAGLIIMGLISFSSIYLGIHWPSDVVASFASAAAWLTIIITILEIRRTIRLPYEDDDDRALSHVSGTAIFAMLCWIIAGTYISYAFPIHLSRPITAPLQSIEKKDIPNKLFDVLPRYSETLLGKPTEPINIIIVGKQETIDESFAQSGWIHPNAISFSTLWRALIASIQNVQDLGAPMTPMFWNTTPNSISYSKPTPQNSVRERHHIRIWDSGIRTEDGDTILFGAASFDKGVKLKSSILIPTHSIDPAIDKEREFVKDVLSSTGLVEKTISFKIVGPTLGKNIVGDTFFTDGQSIVLFLKSPKN